MHGAQAQAALDLDKLLAGLSALEGSVAKKLEQLINRIQYKQYLRMSVGESEERERNVDELVNAAAEFDRAEPEGGLPGFLERIALVSDQDAYDGARAAVSLMTLHAAKGLEFPVCYITGLEDGLLPLGREGEVGDMEEERRLCFVGLTRAKQEAVLTYAATRSRFGQREYTKPSQFIAEVGRDVIDGSNVRIVYDDQQRNLGFRREYSSFRGRRAQSDEAGDSHAGKPGHVRVEYDEPQAESANGSAPKKSFGHYGQTPAHASGPKRKNADDMQQNYSQDFDGLRHPREGAGGNPPASDAPAPNPSEGIMEFRTGDWVSHPTFGRGQIMGQKGIGANGTLLIRFMTGLKTISLKFKKLRKV
jgi:ATP-dependent exoDNAse (exonuclease V) beta subunit